MSILGAIHHDSLIFFLRRIDNECSYTSTAHYNASSELPQLHLAQLNDNSDWRHNIVPPGYLLRKRWLKK